MSKNIRLFVKQEKRIVRLLWRKGLLKGHKLKDLYWAEFKRAGRHRKRKNGKYKFSHAMYYPEVHFATVDYYGECDEHGLVSSVIEEMYWKYADIPNWDEDENSGWPKSTFKAFGRKAFIGYLQSVPTVKISHKINKVLRINNT